MERLQTTSKLESTRSQSGMRKRAMANQTLTIAKQLLALFGPIVLGPIFGCWLSGFWAQGGNTFWKLIDYFPFPVENVWIMEPFGDEFWVRSNDNEIYHIVFPCENG
jgi:hypothetical protein